MRDGKLNKDELAKLGRIYGQLGEVLAKARADDSKDAQAVAEALQKSRHGISDVLRWQDYEGVWKQVKDG